MYNLLIENLKIALIDNFFPTINALKVNKDDKKYEKIKHLSRSEFEKYNNELTLNIMSIFLSNIINFRNLISHGRSFFDFSISSLNELEQYLYGERNDIYLLVEMIVYLWAFNRIEFEIILTDLFFYIWNNYNYFQNWIKTEANKIIIFKYGIVDIYYYLEKNKKLCNILSFYSIDEIFSTISILKNQVDLRQMTMEEIYDKLLEYFKIPNY